MPGTSADGTGVADEATSTGYASSHLPWNLIPPFSPGVTDVEEYGRKIQFLAQIWPAEHLSQSAPRAAMMCAGTAFRKVTMIDPGKLRVNSVEGIKLLVETLGGSWGRTSEENRCASFEKAIYGTTQRHDETHESYVARAEVQFDELISRSTSLREIQAYVLLRQSGLSADEKRRIIMDSGGSLEYQKVVSSIKLLGSKVFSDLQNNGKSVIRTKTYDVNLAEGSDEEDEPILHVNAENLDVDAMAEALAAEGDEE